jgi:hypothetical protein
LSVWICVPSIRPGGGTLPEWKARGYKVAVLRQGELFPEADVTVGTDKYLGWAESINLTVKVVMILDKEAEWFVGGGDDTLPDPLFSPGQIAGQCSEYFGGRWNLGGETGKLREGLETFGVMQPTGDGWNIDKIAGSPWLGREWCKRAYQGHGPLFAGYPHNWADEELQAVATKLGVFWQRPDITQRHNHCMRSGSVAKPEWWDRIVGKDYGVSKPMFEQRKAAGWPGHEPLEMAA